MSFLKNLMKKMFDPRELGGLKGIISGIKNKDPKAVLRATATGGLPPGIRETAMQPINMMMRLRAGDKKGALGTMVNPLYDDMSGREPGEGVEFARPGGMSPLAKRVGESMFDPAAAAAPSPATPTPPAVGGASIGGTGGDSEMMMAIRDAMSRRTGV